MCVQFFDSDFIFGIWNLHFEFEYLPYYSTNVCKFRACCKLFTYLTIFPILYNIHTYPEEFPKLKNFFLLYKVRRLFYLHEESQDSFPHCRPKLADTKYVRQTF